MKLNQSNLPKINQNIPCPHYDRQQLKTGIVHIGVGGFHRSHQAYYIHQLLEKHQVRDWAICGVGLREADRKMYDALKAQDGLYTLITQHPDGREEREVIGSIHEYLLAVDTPDLVLDKMVHPDTRIVSLTITEGGYNFNSNTGAFDFQNPAVQHELKRPDEPRTVYGFLTAALRERKARGIPPFTVLSCDNIQHNGAVVRRMLLAFIQKQDPELADWIAQQVAFPSTMVDRITPVTSPVVRKELKKKVGIEDTWPVVCEPFIQWVVEDKFPNGRPALEKLGVQFVKDVTPYEKMKIRLLNAGHSVLGIPGAIHGHPTIDACMNDRVFARFMRRYMDLEVTPILGSIAGIDLEEYKNQLEERFANPYIKDSVSRICAESSAKLPKFILPTLQENLVSGGSIRYATFLLAAWCFYSDQERNEEDQPLDIEDAQREQLHRFAQRTQKDWTAFLRQVDIFGDLIEHKTFEREYSKTVRQIYQERNIRKLMLQF